MHRRRFLKRSGIGAGGAAALVALGPLAGTVGLSRDSSRRPIRRSIPSMGTAIHFTVVPDRSGDTGSGIEGALAEIEAVDRLMSVHRFDSDLSRVNRDSGRPVPVDPHTLTVAKAAQDYADLTGGALDATILPLMRYWGFMERLDSIPRERNLGPHLERVRYRQVLIRDGQLGLLQMGGELDFGGTAKGYAVDRAVGRLRDAGIAGGLVEAGGDLYAAGRPEAHRKWNIGIRDPLRPDGLFATVEVENEAVATSGGYEQFHLIGGRPVSHLIDPRTGQPVEEIISATVFAPTTMEADALATATSVLGVEAALDLLRQRPAVEGVWVTADGMRWTTPELTGRIRWV